MSSTLTDELFDGLRMADWEDIEALEVTTAELLETLAADRELIRALVAHVPDSPHLLSLCEHYDILDKLVLHDDEAGFRVRLHVFHPGHFDRPHNHRWTYSSRILCGSYKHILYGTDDALTEEIEVGQLKPRMVRVERAGNTYTLHHSMVHAAVSEPHTVSLIIRGPAVKERFLVSDRTTGRAWWQYGAAQESQAEAAAKRMSAAQLAECVRLLTELSVV
jgi:hypothetical protein